MSAFFYIFLFYVGFYFYRLAENHKKNKWVFAILGLITFFFGNFLYVLYFRLFNGEDVDELTFPKVGEKSFLLGFIFAFILFQILSTVWNSKKRKRNNEVDKIGEN